MMKIVIVGSMLLGVALSAFVTDLDNNLIEYDPEDVEPMQTFSLPYPYHGNPNHVLIQPAPIYTDNVIPVATDVEVSSAGLLSTVLWFAFEAAKKAIVFLVSNALALIAGTVVGLGVCKLTSICGSELTIIEAQRELRSIATPERIASVTNFVKEAIRKYSEMQV